MRSDIKRCYGETWEVTQLSILQVPIDSYQWQWQTDRQTDKQSETTESETYIIVSIDPVVRETDTSTVGPSVGLGPGGPDWGHAAFDSIVNS